jgi:hypothetical protein
MFYSLEAAAVVEWAALQPLALEPCAYPLEALVAVERSESYLYLV